MKLVILILFANVALAQKRDTLFYIIGKKADFTLLQSALRTPQDITPRQDSALVKWIENLYIIKRDTVKIK